MAKWKPVVVSEDLYNACKQHYEDNKQELMLKEGIRSLTAFVTYCIREHLKQLGAI